MRRVRIILFLVLLAVLLYLTSFTVFTKVPQGMTRMASTPSAGAPRSEPLNIIYISSSPQTNRIAKAVYYPLIRLGEAMGWWRFHDDTSSAWKDNPCLLEVLLAQPILP